MRSTWVAVGVLLACSSCGDAGSTKAASKLDASMLDAQTDAGLSRDAASAPSACDGESLAPGQYTFELEHMGQTRSYVLSVPTSHDASAPLVLNFHGYSSDASQQEFFSRMDEAAEAKRFVVAYPQGLENQGEEPGPGGTTRSWNAGRCCAAPDTDRDDLGFARAVVRDVQAKVCIDAQRIYATGMSNGGFMTHSLACNAADLFAAFAPVSGSLALPASSCSPARPVPIIMFHGTEDQSVPYAANESFTGARESFAFWRDKNGCTGEPSVSFEKGSARCESYTQCEGGVEVTLCTLTGMGHCWPGQTFCLEGSSTTDLSANDAMWELFQRFSLPR